MGSSARLCGRSVLVVEDEALIAIGLKELFEAEVNAAGPDAIAFIYYTGYDDVDERSPGPPVVAKPASGEVLITTIAQLLNLPSEPNASAQH